MWYTSYLLHFENVIVVVTMLFLCITSLMFLIDASFSIAQFKEVIQHIKPFLLVNIGIEEFK